jgi:hypothetical protein
MKVRFQKFFYCCVYSLPPERVYWHSLSTIRRLHMSTPRLMGGIGDVRVEKASITMICILSFKMIGSSSQDTRASKYSTFTV